MTETTNEIPNGTYTADELVSMRGRRAWNVFVPAEEGQARDTARADLIRDAIGQISEYETVMGVTGAAEIVDDEVVAIVEAE